MRMSEHRQSTRQKSFLRGCIYFNDRRTVIDCLVRDVSDHGARLRFSDSISIPDSFELHIPQKNQTLRVTARWRHGMDVGVSFTDARPAGTSSTSATADLATLAERVQKLESEVAELRRVLRRLKVDLANDVDAA
jgi:hypothetical protein